jgi:chromosome segregation ATPase
MVEIRTLDDALALLDRWEQAYRELEREMVRLENRYQHAKEEAQSLEFLLKHLDPFLPHSMQDAKARAAAPKLYRALAEVRDEEYNPFP